MAKNREYEMAIKIAGQIENSFYQSAKLTKKELAAIAKQASISSMTTSKSFADSLGDAAPAFGMLENAGMATFTAIKTAAAAAATAVGGIAAAAVMVGAPFEAQMSTVQALSGATTQEFRQLNEEAKELGATTKYTATEAGKAMEYMAMAGWKTDDMLAGMEGVLDLASASGEDLGTTADIVTDAMTAFKMGADEVGYFSDVLAATATNSNTTVGMMGETFTYASSIAGALGYDIADVAVDIGLMANAGIKASQAGTALRKLFTETTNGAVISGKAIGTVTVETQNADGSMRVLSDVTEDLRDAFSGLTDSEKAANAEAISGKTGMSGLLAIVNASEADYNKLTNAVENCSGAAERMADIRIDNLAGDATIMKSAMEGLGIQIYENINEPLRSGVQWITDMVGQLGTKLSESGLISDIAKKAPTAVRKLKELTGAVGDFAEPFLHVGGWLLDNPGVIAGAIASVGTALATYKIANGIASMVAALGSMGPVGLGILAIGGVVGIIAGIGTAVKKSAMEAKKANLAAHFGNIALSLSDLDEIAGEIIATNNVGKLGAAISALDDLEGLQKSIDDSVLALDKANWKVSVGIELSSAEMDDYKSDIDSYIQQTQQYAADRQYAVNLAVGIMTDNDLVGRDIVNQVNQFYEGKQGELAELGTELNKAITDAFQDGLLDMDEAERISEIQADMAEIQAALAGTNFDAELETITLKYGGELDAESFRNLQAELQEKTKAAKEDYEEAFKTSAASALSMLKDGETDRDGYNAMLEEFRDNYLREVNKIDVKAANFQINTITEQYGEELEAAKPELEKMKSDLLAYADNVFNAESAGSIGERTSILQQYLASMVKDAEVLSEDTADALKELFEGLQPSIQQMEKTMQQYRDESKEIPKNLADTMKSISDVGALIRDQESLWNITADVLLSDDEYQKMLKKAKEESRYLPEAIGEGIVDNDIAIEQASKRVWKDAVSYANSQFGEGIDVEAPLRIKLEPQYNVKNTLPDTLAGNMGRAKIPGYAKGGIIDKPTLATFAEEVPEAAIPLDGSKRSIGIWKKAGDLLGINQGCCTGATEESFSQLSKEINEGPVSNNSMKIEYRPTIQFCGEAPKKEEMDKAFSNAEKNFEEMMEQWMKNHARYGFAY